MPLLDSFIFQAGSTMRTVAIDILSRAVALEGGHYVLAQLDLA